MSGWKENKGCVDWRLPLWLLWAVSTSPQCLAMTTNTSTNKPTKGRAVLPLLPFSLSIDRPHFFSRQRSLIQPLIYTLFSIEGMCGASPVCPSVRQKGARTRRGGWMGEGVEVRVWRTRLSVRRLLDTGHTEPRDSEEPPACPQPPPPPPLSSPPSSAAFTCNKKKKERKSDNV